MYRDGKWSDGCLGLETHWEFTRSVYYNVYKDPWLVCMQSAHFMPPYAKHQ